MTGQKLNGALNLSRIPRELIKKNNKGEDVVYVDVVENRNGPDVYGNTHCITIYDRANGRAIYLANLRPQAFGGQQAQPAPQPAQQPTYQPPTPRPGAPLPPPPPDRVCPGQSAYNDMFHSDEFPEN